MTEDAAPETMPSGERRRLVPEPVFFVSSEGRFLGPMGAQELEALLKSRPEQFLILPHGEEPFWSTDNDALEHLGHPLSLRPRLRTEETQEKAMTDTSLWSSQKTLPLPSPPPQDSLFKRIWEGLRLARKKT